MKRLLLLLAPVVLALTMSCNRQEPTSTVTFFVNETSSATAPPMSVTYTSDKSGSETMSGITGESWESAILELKQGQFVSMKVDCSGQQFTVRMRVYVDGMLWTEKIFTNPNTTASISGNIPIN